MTVAPEPCNHSSIQKNCASCWHGVVNRQIKHIERLRDMVQYANVDGDLLLASHDLEWFGREWKSNEATELEGPDGHQLIPDWHLERDNEA